MLAATTSATTRRAIHSEHSGTTIPAGTESRRLRLRMDFTDPEMAMLAVTGELDMATTPRLAELLWSRLQTKLTTLVLDLSEVSFLGVDALQLLVRAHSYAAHRGFTLCVINSVPAVERAFAAADLTATLPCFADVPTARTALGLPPR